VKRGLLEELMRHASTKFDTPLAELKYETIRGRRKPNRKGNIVSEDDATRYGQETKHVLTHPERMLFVDEVGANTIQKQVGNIGGRKFLVARGMRPQERNAYNICNFTVLEFTAVVGAPVMCCIIVAAKTLTTFEASGIHYLSEDVLENGTLEEKATKDEYNNGCDILFTMGPT
jgi:hypothetical protein